MTILRRHPCGLRIYPHNLRRRQRFCCLVWTSCHRPLCSRSSVVLGRSSTRYWIAESPARIYQPLRAFHPSSTATMDSSSTAAYTEIPIIELNDVEAKLKHLLLDVARFINPSNPSQLRFTGGWVRDKLLGRASNDIDVAINDMTGYQFGLRMKDYLDNDGNREKHGLQLPSVSAENVSKKDKIREVQSLHKIEANPEKSKHLETVTTKIFGLDVDLVNLRKESYTELSRNPTMEFGTPEEDALRRDATVNALFYNLQSEQVEDLTHHGLEDMRLQIIRTPLEPYRTFKDDPLRVLRLIRFASRLHYRVDLACKKAMRDETIKEALKIKISRERIGVELEKMLKGPDPHTALSLIHELSLYNTIFCDPTTPNSFVPDTKSWKSYLDSLGQILSSREALSSEILLSHNSDKYLAWMLATFIPFVDAPVPESKKGKTPILLATMVAREGIKATNKVSEMITLAMQHFEEIITTKDNFIKQGHQTQIDPNPAGRDTLGMAIRKWGPSWRHQAIFALLMDKQRSNREVVQEWDKFLGYLRAQGLLNAFEFKPLLNGSEIAKALDVRPGPWMKETLEVVMAWQLRNPDASVEAALEALRNSCRNREAANESEDQSDLREFQGELVASLVRHFLLLTIRPLFAKTTQTHADRITPQGRRVEKLGTIVGPSPKNYEWSDDDNGARLWKRPDNSHALQLLKWVLRSLTPELAESNWPLLIPPILALLDDMDTTHKATGCDFLRYLLEATSPLLLKRTNLAEVLEEALKPSLSYLPTLTPEPDSTHIINAAYPALFTLIQKKALASRNSSEQKALKTKELTQTLHSHLLPSISHVSPPTSALTLPYPTLMASLLQNLSKLVSLLGLGTVPQLQFLLPVLAELASSPFIVASLEGLAMLKAVIETLQSVIACSWIRIARWRVDIFAMCCKSWMELTREEAGDLNFSQSGKESEDTDGMVSRKRQAIEDNKSSLRVCVSMLVRAVEATSNSDASGIPSLLEKEGDETPIYIRNEIHELARLSSTLSDLFLNV